VARCHAGEREQGRRHVGERDRRLDPRPSRPSGCDHDEGDADLLLEEARPRAEEAVLAELLTVIGRQHDHCVLQHTALLQHPEESAQCLVERSHLPVVQAKEELRVLGADGVSLESDETPVDIGDAHRVDRPDNGVANGRGRLVRAVRLHAMQVEEEWPPHPALPRQPAAAPVEVIAELVLDPDPTSL
jgi:hypothetical protein